MWRRMKMMKVMKTCSRSDRDKGILLQGHEGAPDDPSPTTTITSQKPILLSSVRCAWVAWGLRPCSEAILPDKLPFLSHSYTPERSLRSPPLTAVFHNLSTNEGRWGGSESGAFCFPKEMISLKMIQESSVQSKEASKEKGGF